ncbi:MAG: hypothetical protein V4509_04850 [Patescibacteria group bacterium]
MKHILATLMVLATLAIATTPQNNIGANAPQNQDITVIQSDDLGINATVNLDTSKLLNPANQNTGVAVNNPHPTIEVRQNANVNGTNVSIAANSTQGHHIGVAINGNRNTHRENSANAMTNGPNIAAMNGADVNTQGHGTTSTAAVNPLLM